MKSQERAARERSFGAYVPYSCLVAPDVVKTREGAYLRVWKVRGLPFETADEKDLSIASEQLNTMLRTFGGDKVSFYFHLIRRETSDRLSDPQDNEFARQFSERYFSCVSQSVLLVNEWFVTVVYRPSTVSRVERRLVREKTLAEMKSAEEAALRGLDEVSAQLESGLEKYAPERLGEFEEGGERYSSVLAFLNFLLSGEWQKVLLPRAPLYEVLGTAQLLFGTETVEQRGVSESRFLRLLDLKDYPESTSPGTFNSLLYAQFPFVLTQSFVPLLRYEAREKLSRQQRQMAGSEDGAVSQVVDLSLALDGLMSGRFGFGEYHFSLAVFGSSPSELREATTRAQTNLQDGGFLPVLSSLAMEAAYFAQLPGNFAFRPRPTSLTTQNLSCFAGFHNFSSGKRDLNPWGEAVALLQTPSGHPFYFNFHEAGDHKDARGDKRLGNTLVLGQSGAGKTVLLASLLVFAQKYKPTSFFFDKDRGAELVIRALGGKYLALETGAVSGLNPFQLEPSAENKSFLRELVGVLVSEPGVGLGASDKAKIASAVETVMGFSPSIRRLGLLPQLMTQGSDRENSVVRRLEPWVGSGPLAWVFDNPRDVLDFTTHRTYGIDGTSFLDNATVRTPISLYLLHRMEQVINGGRFFFVMDEFWKWLGDSAFSNFVYNKLKTIRKQNGFGVFATQSPSDVLESDIARAVIEQCATSVYLPNPRADQDEYVNGFKLTSLEYEILTKMDPGNRLFLVKQGNVSTIAGLNLAGFEELPVFSGSTDSIKILHEIISEVGDSPEAWLPIFYQRMNRDKQPKQAGAYR